MYLCYIMFFCNKCDYKYDITKNIENVKLEKKDKNLAYFQCDNCGMYELIEPGTLIYSKSAKNQVLIAEQNKDLIYDATLPRTRKYVCPNKKCDSHSNSKTKEAVFYKKDHYVTYICCVCETFFSI